MGAITDVSQIGVKSIFKVLTGVLAPGESVTLMPDSGVAHNWYGRLFLTIGNSDNSNDFDIHDIAMLKVCGSAVPDVLQHKYDSYAFAITDNDAIPSTFLLVSVPVGCGGDSQVVSLKNNLEVSMFYCADIGVVAGPTLSEPE